MMAKEKHLLIMIDSHCCATSGLSRDEVIEQRYAVLEGPETDAETVQELWLAVGENREITVELVRPCDFHLKLRHHCFSVSNQAHIGMHAW